MEKNITLNYIAAFKLNVVIEAEKSNNIADAQNYFGMIDRHVLECVKNKNRLLKMTQKMKARRGGSP